MIRRISLPELSAIRDDSERRGVPGGGVILACIVGGMFWGPVILFGVWVLG